MEDQIHPSLEGRISIPAQLVFDSSLEPRPFGMRGDSKLGQHLLYQTENLCLDLRFSGDTNGESPVLVGQLANRAKPLEPLGEIPIFLVAGRILLSRAISNQLGEFQVACPSGREMRLCVLVGTDRMIEVPVDHPASRAA